MLAATPGYSDLLRVAAICLGLTAQTAWAQTPSEKERTQFQAHLTKSVALLSLGLGAAGARKECETARALAGRFSPNDLWRARIENCFALVAHAEGQKAEACRRFSSAAESYARVLASPKADGVESDYDGIRKRHTELRCPGRIAALPVRAPAAGALPAKKDVDTIFRELLVVYGMVRLHDTDKAAVEKCGFVRSYASRFPADSFMAGAVEECFAMIEGFRKSKAAACARNQAAEARYKSISGTHPAVESAKSRVGLVRETREKLGC